MNKPSRMLGIIAILSLLISGVSLFLFILSIDTAQAQEHGLLWKYETGSYCVNSVSISQGGEYIAAERDGVYLFNKEGKLLWKYKIGDTTSVSISQDGEYIAAGSGDNYVYFFKEGKLLWKYRTRYSINSVSITPDGSYIAAGSGNKHVYLLNKEGKLLWKYDTDFGFEPISITSDGKYIAVGGFSGNVYLFSKEEKLLWKYETGDRIKSVSISQDGEYIAAGSEDKHVYLLNKEGKLLWKYETDDEVESVSISQDGEYIAAGSDDNYVYLFNKEGKLLWMYETGDEVESVSISQDGSYIAAGSLQGYVYLFGLSWIISPLIEDAKKAISENERYNVKKAEELLSKAEAEFNARNYEAAYSYVLKAKSLALDIDQDGVTNEEDFAPTIKNIYIYTFAFALLVLAALTTVSLCVRRRMTKKRLEREMISEKETKEKAKPEIEVDLSEKTFKPNYWKTLYLLVRNKGNAYAKDVKINFSKEVEVKGLKELSVNSGEEEKISISLKPKEVGDVPLVIKTTYKDVDGKEYSAENLFTLNVIEEPAEEPSRRVEEIPTEKEELTIERAIYDPCKRDFIEGALPRMKEWINRYNLGAYWFAISIQNNTDRAIEEWGVELETSAALKIKESKIEGIEIEIPYEAHLNSFKISVPKEYGIVIPKGGAQRVYFKLRADKPKTTYEISGVFKSEITGDVPIRAKEFKYLCDVGVSPEAVKAELKKTFSEKDAARLVLSFKIVQEIDRMCNTGAKTEEYLDRLSVLRNYTEGFSDKFTTQVDEFSRFMKQEQLEYLDEEYKVRVRRFCTNLVDVWISEFLKG